MRKIMLISLVLLLATITISAGVTLSNLVIVDTAVVDGEYIVKLEDNNKYFFVFDLNKTNPQNIGQQLEDRINIVNAIEIYDQKIANGLDGCKTTTECHNWGWLNDTVCYKGQCIDQDKTSQLDTQDVNKDALDEALGIGATP